MFFDLWKRSKAYVLLWLFCMIVVAPIAAWYLAAGLNKFLETPPPGSPRYDCIQEKWLGGNSE